MLRWHNNLHLKWQTRSNMSVQRRNGQQTWILTWLCPKCYGHPWISHPKVRIYGDKGYLRRGLVPFSKSPLTLYIRGTQPGGQNKAESELVAIVAQKRVSGSKSDQREYLWFPREIDLEVLHMEVHGRNPQT